MGKRVVLRNRARDWSSRQVIGVVDVCGPSHVTGECGYLCVRSGLSRSHPPPTTHSQAAYKIFTCSSFFPTLPQSTPSVRPQLFQRPTRPHSAFSPTVSGLVSGREKPPAFHLTHIHTRRLVVLSLSVSIHFNHKSLVSSSPRMANAS